MCSSSTVPAKAGSGALRVEAVDAQVWAPLGLLQRLGRVHARRRKGGGPLARPAVVVRARRVDVGDAAQRVDGGAPLGGERHRRIHEQGAVAEAQDGHRRCQAHADDAHRIASQPHSLGERRHGATVTPIARATS